MSHGEKERLGKGAQIEEANKWGEEKLQSPATKNDLQGTKSRPEEGSRKERREEGEGANI